MCRERGRGKGQRPTRFLHLPKIPEPCKIVHHPGTKLPNTNLWETFPIQLQSPSSPGALAPLLHSAVLGGYTRPGYHRHHCPASETHSRCKVSVPREAEAGALVTLSLCYLPPQTQVRLGKEEELGSCTLIPLFPPRGIIFVVTIHCRNEWRPRSQLY